MSHTMALAQEGARAASTPVVSPELVLVDPGLAIAARSALPDLADSLTMPRPALRQPVSSGRAGPVFDARALAPQPPDDRAAYRVLAGIAAVVAAFLVFFDVRVQVGDKPASAELPVAEFPAVAQPKPSSGAPAGALEVGKPQPLAWAPVAGASWYHLELFRGTRKVYVADVSRPQVTIPVSWRAAGARRRLVPGEYRWYVWPVISGSRASTAIVQAQLVVAPR